MPRSVIVELDGYRPQVAPSAFIAPTAVLIGNVVVGEDASVWYGAVLRADHGERAIVIGARSNIQDNCVLHVALEYGTIIGEDVTVGHGAILEGCQVENGALIGMNAVILDRVRVGARSLVAANSSVLAGMEIPPDTVVAGSPAQIKKQISGTSRWWVEYSAKHYVERAQRYRAQGLDR